MTTHEAVQNGTVEAVDLRRNARAIFKQACLDVIAANRRRHGGYLMPYACSYAKTALEMLTHDASDYALDYQATYILNNLTGWRGDAARKAKAGLRALQGNVADGPPKAARTIYPHRNS